MYTASDLTSLANIGNGAAIEMFDIELQKVLRNLNDPNKQGNQERSVTLTVRLKPGETKGIVQTKITCNSKLSGQRAHDTTLMVGMDQDGKMESRELFQQKPLPFNEKVVPIDKTQT